MNDHIVKPVDPARLYAVIEHWLRCSGVEPLFSAAEPSCTATPGPARAASDSAIDWASLEQRYHDRPDFIGKLLRSALDYYGDTPRELERVIAAADFESIARIAHGLKSTGGNLMAHRLMDIAKQTDAAVRRRDRGGLQLADALRLALEALLDEGRQWLDNSGAHSS